jgi:hypothetical protein
MMPSRILLPGLLLIALVACTAASDTATGPRAAAIVCHAAYRGNASGPIEREETLTLADEDGEGSLSFADVEFHAFYSAGSGDNERALRLKITQPRRKTAITTQLYQLPLDSGPVNQFVGGHGFTGLNYVYTDEAAELQFWCAVE